MIGTIRKHIFAFISIIITAFVMMPIKSVVAAEVVAGILAASSGTVERKHSDNSLFDVLNIGDKIYLNDTIQTGDDGRIQILLMDETTFSIGANSSIMIDDFIYDPSTQGGAMDVNITSGVFRFISGRIAKTSPENMRVQAGNAVISIRGTEVIGTVEDGQSKIVLLSGAIDIAATTDACLAGGAGCVQTIIRPGFGVELNDNGKVTPPSRVEVEEITAVVDSLDASADEKPEEEEKEQEELEPEEPTSNENEEEAEADIEEPVEADSDDQEDAQEEGTEDTAENSEETANDNNVETAEADAGDETVETVETVEDDVVNDGDVPAVNDIAEEPVLAGNDAEDDKKPEKISGFDLIVLKSLGLVEDVEDETPSTLETSIIETAAPEDTKEDKEDFDAKPEDDVDERVENDLEKIEDEKKIERTTITAENNNPVLAELDTINFDDTTANDTFNEASDTSSATDADGDSLTFSVSGMTADTSRSGYTHVVSGEYGLLYFDQGSGKYIYVPDDEKIEGLKENTSESFNVSVSDEENTDTQTLLIAISSTNDTPDLASVTAVSLSDTANDDTFSAQSDSLSARDRDDTSFTYSATDMSADTSQSGYTHSVSGDYGTLYLNSGSGAYTYIPDDAAIEGLKTSESDIFTLTTSDGAATASQTLTATITGTNDTPTLADLTALSFIDTAIDDTFASSSGTAQGSDRDTSDTLNYGIDGGTATSLSGYTYEKVGTYGIFYINEETGEYQFIPRDSAIEGLSDSANEIFSVTVTDADGSVTEGEITVSLTGVNDTPTLSTIAAISYSDTTGDDSFSDASGTAQANDRDTGATLTYSIESGVSSTLSNFNTMLAGTYGTLHINEETGAYRYVPLDSSIEGLKADTSEDFTVLVSDGAGGTASSTVSVNITGADDAPLLNISRASIPSSVAYDETTITSDNLLSNADLSDYATGWERIGSVCTDASSTSNTCSRINNGQFETGPVTGGLSQTINPAEILGLTDAQIQKGGTLSWSTEVKMNSNWCMGSTKSNECADTAEVSVTAKDGSGTTIVDEKDERTQVAQYQTWTDQKNVNTAPVEVTYSMSGKDYTYWGCSPENNKCHYGPRFRNPSVTYSYAVDDDVVISTLSATDSDDDGDHTYSLVSDSSNNGIFEIRGNQLILKGGSSVAAAGDDVYDLVIGITDQGGVTVNADVSISVADAANVPQQIAQQVSSTEDSVYSVTSDFGSGTVSSDDLPSWLSLTDSGNGRAVISGTAPNSGEVSFSVYSVQNGEKTTARYVLTVGESCTSAYCEQFVSSSDTVNLETYTVSGNDQQIGNVQYYHFNDWNSLYTALNSGTGVFQRTGIALDANDGTWEGNLQLSIDFSNRNFDSSAWGTFSNYNGGNSGSFRIEESDSFSSSNTLCTRPGECTIFTNPDFLKTCTGSTCNSGASTHSNVNLQGEGVARLLTNNNNGYGVIGSLTLTDQNNGGATAAETSGDGLVLEAQ